MPTWDTKSLKATPISTDEILIIDTADSRNQKRATFASLPASLSDWNGNNLVGFGHLESNAAIPSNAGEIRLGNTESIQWRNPANDGNIVLQGDNLNFLALSNARGINLENDDFIRWDGNDLRRILNDTLGFQFSVESGDDIRLHFDQTDEYDFDATQADFLGNNLVNFGFIESSSGNPSTIGNIRLGNNQTIGWRTAGNAADVTLSYTSIDNFLFNESNNPVILRLDANHTTPLNGTIVGEILFQDDNSVDVSRVYGQIFTLVENPTSGSERGSMTLAIGDGVFTVPFIVLNDADDDNITFKKALQIDAQDIITDTTTGTKIGTGTTQKLGFWNVAPIVQPSHIVDADGTLADITTKFNTLLAQMASTGLQANA